MSWCSKCNRVFSWGGLKPKRHQDVSIYVWYFGFSCRGCDGCCHVWSQGEIRILVSMCEIWDSHIVAMNTIAVFEAREISGYQYLCVRFQILMLWLWWVLCLNAREITGYEYLCVRFVILTPWLWILLSCSKPEGYRDISIYVWVLGRTELVGHAKGQ
jgi:hypothetical protein